jgi:hypothetical protein
MRINSPRNCGWPRISAGRSISAWAAISCTTRRSRIITSSTTPSRFSANINKRGLLRRQSASSPDAPHIFRSIPRWRIAAAPSGPIRPINGTQFWIGLRMGRSQSAEPDRRPGPQLFPQPESLSAEFLCAGFGEVYYQVTPDVKLTAACAGPTTRNISSRFQAGPLVAAKAIPSPERIDQEWKEWTGRFVANWTPKLDFTDQSLFYGSYSRGYKGGGANPPGVVPFCYQPPPSVSLRPAIDSSADLQAGIRGCVRTGHEEHAARRRDDVQRRCLLLQISELSDLPDRRPHLGQSELQRQCQGRRSGIHLGTGSRIALQSCGRL